MTKTKTKTIIRWNTGAPPRRGAYQVRSEGCSPNCGWRYWFGPALGWGCLHSKRQRAIDEGMGRLVLRRSRITRQVLWGRVVNAEAEAVNRHCAMVAKHAQIGDIVTHTRRGGLIEEHKLTNLNWQGKGLLAGWATDDTGRIGKAYGGRGHGCTGDAFDIHPTQVTHINRVPVSALR